MKHPNKNVFDKTIARLIKAALVEDVGTGDITTGAIIGKNEIADAVVIAKEPMVVAGQMVAEKVFKAVDKRIDYEIVAQDGARVKAREAIAVITGPAAGMLIAERVALNFLQRLSGIATLTAEFVKKTKGTGAQILDTRKTTPCLRMLEKYAVRVGGGVNHRMGLFDAVLIKDNHIASAGGVKKAIEATRGGIKRIKRGVRIEVECTTQGEVKEALDAGADAILLDNMNLRDMKKAVKLIADRATVEVSGGMTLESIARVASTGVDFISVGALTHSARAVDMSLEFK